MDANKNLDPTETAALVESLRKMQKWDEVKKYFARVHPTIPWNLLGPKIKKALESHHHKSVPDEKTAVELCEALPLSAIPDEIWNKMSETKRKEIQTKKKTQSSVFAGYPTLSQVLGKD